MASYQPLNPIIQEKLSCVYDMLKESRGYKISQIREIRSALTEKKFLEMYDYFKSCGNDQLIIGYHATNMKVTNSIVLNGFTAPYQEKYATVHGQKYGGGVYVSDSFGYAMHYYEGIMFICLCAMGQSRTMSPSEGRKYANDNKNQSINCDTFYIKPEIVLRASIQVLPIMCCKSEKLKNPSEKSILEFSISEPLTGINTKLSDLCLKHFEENYDNPIVHELLAIGFDESNDCDKAVENVKRLLDCYDYL